MAMNPIKIDGSKLEGGGQILRNALSYSCILNKPVHIINIRHTQPKPGLAAQHFSGVQLLKQMCKATVKGDSIGSTELEFYPKQIQPGKYSIDIQTAGSVTLVVQVALPVALFAGGQTKLSLKGGTNVTMAPQVDFMTEIFRHNLEMFGATFDFDLFKRGYYPKGGGNCDITINPVKQLQAVDLTKFGKIKNVFGWSFIAGRLPMKIAQEMEAGATNLIREFGVEKKVPIIVKSYKEHHTMTSENCSGIIVGCETTAGCVLGGSALYNKMENSRQIGERAAQEIIESLKYEACVDSHVQDQLIIYMTLAKGVTRMKTTPPTSHTKTAIQISELMTKAKFNIVENRSGTCIIECSGIGVINENVPY